MAIMVGKLSLRVTTTFVNAAWCFLALALFTDAYAANKNQCRQALVVNEVTELDFGNFVGSAAGKVTVSTSGARSTTGPILVGGGTASPAVFSLHSTIAGCQRFRFRVRFTRGTLGGPGSNMRVNKFKTNPKKKQIRLNPGANDPVMVTVGADVKSGASQSAGQYTGVYNVKFEIK